MGHRLGMPHATVYRLNNGSSAQVGCNYAWTSDKGLQMKNDKSVAVGLTILLCQ